MPDGRFTGRLSGKPGIAVAGRISKDPATAAVAVTAVSKRNLRMAMSITYFTPVTQVTGVTFAKFWQLFDFYISPKTIFVQATAVRRGFDVVYGIKISSAFFWQCAENAEDKLSRS